MRKPRVLPRLLLLAGPASVLALPALVQAQEPLPAVLPEVVFLIEDSSRMGDDWDGDATLTGADARWVYVRSAVAQVIQNAPVGMVFGVALTADGTDDSAVGLESDFGFEPLAYPGMPTADIISALNAHATSNSGERTFAESYAALLDTWAEETFVTPRSWAGGPFQYSCSQLVVIIIGSNIGQADSNPTGGYYTLDPMTGGLECNDDSGFQGCLADNVANWAWDSFAAPLAGSGAVRTYTLLIDANSPSISTEAAPYFQATANVGQGLYYSTVPPGAIQTSIWNILTDTFSGSYSNAALSATPDGSQIFASWFEVQGGHPLYKGHLLAWDIDTDPSSATYGQMIPGAGPYGEAWDAGQRLASRDENPAEINQTGWDPYEQRVGFTAYASMTFMSDPQAFDATSVATDADDLTQLLVDIVPSTSNEACLPLPQDFDYDCDSDHDDAQILVNFIRGDETATFLHTGLPRYEWKMGDTGHSVAATAPSSVMILSAEPHVFAYTERLATYPGMIYIASNAGMLHAFNLDNADADDRGAEYWFYVPRMKAHKSPTDPAVGEYDGFQIDDLMRSGQTYVNDGRLVVDHVWLDGYMNGLGSAPPHFTTGCSGPGYFPAEADGVIDPEGCEWHRVVVWAGGYGARHVYALDVTDPYAPLFLWERNDLTGNTGPGKGRAVGTPALGPFVDRSGSPERRWIVFWGAGEQSPGVSVSSPGGQKVHASVFIHDMDTTTARVPTEYPQSGFRSTGTATHPHVSVWESDADGYEEYDELPPPDAGTLASGLFGSPAVVDLDGDGSVDVAYIGDSLGYVTKTLFNEYSPASPVSCVFATPDPADQARHLWYRPAVFFSLDGEVMVYYGSGSPHDVYSAEQGGLYVKKDPQPFACAASQVADCAATSTIFNSNGFYSFTGIGEKMVGDPIAVFGRLYFTTHSPGSDPCVLGTSRIYGLNVETCGGGIPDVTTDSYSQDSTGLYTEVPGLISAPMFANGRIYALSIDGDGLDADSLVDNLQVVPTDMGGFFFAGFRHVF